MFWDVTGHYNHFEETKYFFPQIVAKSYSHKVAGFLFGCYEPMV